MTPSMRLISIAVVGLFGLVGQVARADDPPTDKRSVRFEDVSFQSIKKDIKLCGTLTIPDTKSPHPTILIIQCGGPQNRDGGTLPQHCYFLSWAKLLSEAGFLVLRTDRRGIGASGGDYRLATTADFADDAVAAIEFLMSRPDVDKKNIGIIGHCEGGIVGSTVAAQSEDVSFLVLMATPGLKGKDFFGSTWHRQFVAEGADPEEVRRRLGLLSRILDAVAAGKDDEAVFAAVKKDLRAYGVDSSDPVQVTTFKAYYLSKWFRHFITIDPLPTFRRVRCPVLVLQGDRDSVVDVNENLNLVAKAFRDGKSRDVRVERLSRLNHMFQTCRVGTADEYEYERIREVVSPRVMEIISDWIRQRVRATSEGANRSKRGE